MNVLTVDRWRAEGPVVLGTSEAVDRAGLHERVQARADELRRDTSGAQRVRCVAVEPDVGGVVELLATWEAGQVVAPLNPKLSDEARGAARAALSDARVPADACAVLWTSGTSGRPRGVALSWANLEASAAAARQRLGLRPDDAWLLSLSPAHVGGLALLTRALLIGNPLFAPGQFDLGVVTELLGRSDGPTHVSLVPTQLHRLLETWRGRSAPDRLRCVLIGGAHAPRSLVDRAVSSGWPIALTYGSTEMTSQVATSSPSEVRGGRRDVGTPLADVELRVTDDGEILARGPTRALGYVGPDVPDLADEAGWYHTGDLGVLDPDGRLSVTGRRVDRIVSGGVTLDAVAIEEDLRRHPTVLDVCVVGIPDAVWGERVAAWIEPVEGEFDQSAFELWASEEIESARRPRVWRVGGRLPRNANGKVDRTAVRAGF